MGDTMAADIFWLIVVFVFGATFGSFLNVCIYRLPLGKSLLWPPSHCPKCAQPVGRWNIPIVGYFLLRGRCAECGEKFSIQYPAVEFLNASLMALVFYKIVILDKGPWPLFLVYAVLTMILVVATFTDLAWKIIPRQLTVFGCIVALIASAAYPQMHSLYTGFQKSGWAWMDAMSRWIAKAPPVDGLLVSLAGMVAGVVLILVVRGLGSVVFRREAMGLGDAKLMAVIGGVLGWRAVPVVFLVAAFIGAVIGILSYFRTRDHEIPLGPFLSLGALIVILWGNELMHLWFVGIMHIDAPRLLPELLR